MASCDNKIDLKTGLVTIFGTYDRDDYDCCIWKDLFSADENEGLHEELNFVGFVSVVLLFWLFFKWESLALKEYLNERTYYLLFQFNMVMLMRITTALMFMMFKQSFPGWLVPCNLSACAETCFEVLEIEFFTHNCIERYVVAKNVKNGWEIQVKHYKRFALICVSCATAYSVFPYLISAYALDFRCESCTLDMVLQDDFSKFVILATMFLKTVKPLTLMVAMLVAAKYHEANFDDNMKKRGESFYTDIIIRVAAFIIPCWIPEAALRGYVVFHQLQTKEIFAPPTQLIRVAFLLHMFLPAIATMVILYEDYKLQKKPPVITEQVEEKKNE